MSDDFADEILNDEQLKEISDRAGKATAGPWDTIQATLVRVVSGDIAIPIFRSEAPVDFYRKKRITHKVMCRAYADEVNNANFIAHARQDIPALLKAVSYWRDRAERQMREDGK